MQGSARKTTADITSDALERAKIHRKLRAVYGHTISDQEIEFIANAHFQHGVNEVRLSAANMDMAAL